MWIFLNSFRIDSSDFRLKRQVAQLQQHATTPSPRDTSCQHEESYPWVQALRVAPVLMVGLSFEGGLDLQYYYNSEPAGGLEKYDASISTGISYRF